jgi:hypothetical protein|tara:strand:+ start:262 stop:570 length:309 start_codon:yes stop_codon:yes gene_type:complete
MDILSIILIAGLSLFVLELIKHMFTRTILKVIVISLVGLIIFFTVINSLDKENVIDNDNKYIQAGATISQNFENQPIWDDLKEKFKTLILNIDNTISKKLEK